MKNLILVLALILPLNAMAEGKEDSVAIEPANRKEPLTLTLKGACHNGTDKLPITRVSGRLNPTRSREDCNSQTEVLIVNADGHVWLQTSMKVALSSWWVTPLNARAMMAALATASELAPVIIEVNRETLQVERIRPTNDILSLSDEGNSPQG